MQADVRLCVPADVLLVWRAGEVVSWAEGLHCWQLDKTLTEKLRTGEVIVPEVVRKYTHWEAQNGWGYCAWGCETRHSLRSSERVRLLCLRLWDKTLRAQWVSQAHGSTGVSAVTCHRYQERKKRWSSSPRQMSGLHFICDRIAKNTARSTVLLEKLTGSQLVKIMEPEGSLPHSQVPATCPYPQPARSSPYSPHPTSWRPILILSFHLRLGHPIGLFPSGFPTKILYMPVLSSYMLRTPPISFFSIWSPEQFWVRSTDH